MIKVFLPLPDKGDQNTSDAQENMEKAQDGSYSSQGGAHQRFTLISQKYSKPGHVMSCFTESWPFLSS